MMVSKMRFESILLFSLAWGKSYVSKAAHAIVRPIDSTVNNAVGGIFGSIYNEIDSGFQAIVDNLHSTDELELEMDIFTGLQTMTRSIYMRLNTSTTVPFFDQIGDSFSGNSLRERKRFIKKLAPNQTESERVLDTLWSSFKTEIPTFVSLYAKSDSDTQFKALYDHLKISQLHSLRYMEETKRAAISKHPKELFVQFNDSFEDENFWNKTYKWRERPMSDLDSLHIIDAVQLNRVRNHISPHYHVEAGLPRRLYSRIFPEYTADLDLQNSARIFPLNIAQDTSMTGSSILLQQNLKALSALGLMADDATAELNVIDTLMTHHTRLDTISTAILAKNHEQPFKSVPAIKASLISLEHSLIDKQLRYLVDQITHNTYSYVLDIETDQKLHLIDNSAASKVWCDNIKSLQHHQDSLIAIFTESHLEWASIYIQHATNLYLVAHELWRSLIEIRAEGNATISYHKAAIYNEAADERRNEMISLQRIRIIGEEGRKTLLQIIDLCFDQMSTVLLYSISTTEGMQRFLILLLFLLLLVFALTMTRHIVMIAVIVMHKAFLMPSIVRETSSSVWLWGRRNRSSCPSVILPPNQQKQLLDLISATCITRTCRSPLRNLLIYGPPGSGKTLLARKLLLSIPDTPYVIMSGSDLIPLGRSAPMELKRILLWAIRRRAIVVIDEAECALGQRLSKTEDNSTDLEVARDIINVFLSLTGEASNKLMLVILTCHPEQLDDAVLDRCDDVFHLDMPSEKERYLIIEQSFQDRFTKTTDRSGRHHNCRYLPDFDMNLLRQLSLRNTEGFSGRELNQIVLAIMEETYLTEDSILTTKIWEEVTKRMCCSINMKKKMTSKL